MLQPNQPIDRGRDPHISNLCESGCFGYPKKNDKRRRWMGFGAWMSRDGS